MKCALVFLLLSMVFLMARPAESIPPRPRPRPFPRPFLPLLPQTRPQGYPFYADFRLRGVNFQRDEDQQDQQDKQDQQDQQDQQDWQDQQDKQDQ
ncbi:PREDICTED: alpha/beta-gliadin clone PW8142-like [Poecilia mexicana]|uniref:alpha/beta-gliadin clone PW8142-like n=1 Tax=Poecilia mexicana TaxID=48701 RepID=UPI00072DFF65|nr:PREDICTED: alpha/beta-gliadin clone PW8142-like [Poecilia mexicana]